MASCTAGLRLIMRSHMQHGIGAQQYAQDRLNRARLKYIHSRLRVAATSRWEGSKALKYERQRSDRSSAKYGLTSDN